MHRQSLAIRRAKLARIRSRVLPRHWAALFDQRGVQVDELEPRFLRQRSCSDVELHDGCVVHRGGSVVRRRGADDDDRRTFNTVRHRSEASE